VSCSSTCRGTATVCSRSIAWSSAPRCSPWWQCGDEHRGEGMGRTLMTYDGLAPTDLAARLRVPGCLSLVSVTSTMDIIHELAGEGAPAGTVVLADEQVAGRGRQGRHWHSPRGLGIWLG